MKPLAIDLFCGLGGWTEGLLDQVYRVVGFDIKVRPYAGQLVLQDVTTIHGSQFKNAALIVASPPCQAYSMMAMPFSRGKQIAAALRGGGEFPDKYKGSRTLDELNACFNACFRIQREASEAAGRHIPMVVENVKGAAPWVGRAKWHYGSFYLYGDVPALMPFTQRAQKHNPDGTDHGQGSWLAIADSKDRGSAIKKPGQDWSRFAKSGEVSPHWNMAAATKNNGGSWFAVANNTTSGHKQNPDGRKTVGHVNKRDGHGHTRHLTNQAESDAVKQPGLSGPAWFDKGAAAMSSKSSARKQASAEIAKIPFPLAQYIAKVYLP